MFAKAPPLLSAALLALCVTAAAAAPALTVTPASLPPGAKLSGTATGFAAVEPIDVYQDTTDVRLAVSSAAGGFTLSRLPVPVATLPGQHWITAIGRRSGTVAQAAFTVSTPWAQSGFDPGGTNYNRTENVLTPSVVPTLGLAWLAKPATAGSFAGQPVTANGRVYVAASNTTVTALDQITGAQIWSTDVASPAIGLAVSLGQNIVLAVTASGKLVGLNAIGGKIVWTTDLGTTAVTPTPSLGNDGRVYLSTLATGESFYRLRAFAVATGAAQWTSDFISVPPPGTPRIAGGRVFVCGDDTRGATTAFLAMDSGTGSTQWSFSSPFNFNCGSVVLTNGEIFVLNTQGILSVINAAVGQQLFTIGLPSSLPVLNSLIVADGKAYLSDSTHKTVSTLDVTQSTVSSINYGLPLNGYVSRAGQTLFLPTLTGDITTLDLTTNRASWIASLNGNAGAASVPAISDGMVFVVANGTVNAFAANNGAGAAALRRARHFHAPSRLSLRPNLQLVAGR